MDKAQTAYHSLSDEMLMHHLSKGDALAFETLYDRYFGRMTAYIRRISTAAHPEDLVQDVFVKIIENKAYFDPTKKFSTWIYTVVTNRCRNEWRNQETRQRINEEIQVDETHYHLKHDLDSRSLMQQIEIVMNGLSKKERAIFSLRFEEELPLKDIAEILEIPEGSVKSSIFYLLKKLSAYLEPYK